MGPMMIRGRRLSLPTTRIVTRRRLILLAVALIVAVQVISGLASRTDTTPASDATIDAYLTHQLADGGSRVALSRSSAADGSSMPLHSGRLTAPGAKSRRTPVRHRLAVEGTDRGRDTAPRRCGLRCPRRCRRAIPALLRDGRSRNVGDD